LPCERDAIKARGVRVECSDEVKAILLQEGYSERYGARNLERVVEQKLGSLIAAELLRGEVVAGRVMQIELNKNGFFHL
jgi:ATP-dependent Clp protease ATP-binding subunit ClpC